MNNTLLIVANWKANTVPLTSWLQKFRADYGELSNSGTQIEVALAASYPTLFLLEDSLYHLASQDVSMFPEGAYTGEVPAPQLNEFGVTYTLLGHSERRRYLGETTEIVEKKLEQAMKCKLIPIICAQTQEEIPKSLAKYSADSYYVMYEPAEAISTYGQYHAENPDSVARTLKDWSETLPRDTRFLYGGSVNEENIASFLPLASKANLLSGFVVGHASLDPDKFFSIISQCHSLL